MRGLLILLLIAVAAAVLPDAARADQAGWDALREPDTAVLIRHAEAPGTGDPAGFRLDDCGTQRNLSRRGRRQAEAMGQALRTNAVTIDRVLTSQWCRTRETAELMAVAPVEEEPALNSFFSDRRARQAQSERLIERLRALPKGAKVALVTHQVNITALTGVYPRSGEMIVVRLEPDGRLAVLGRIRV
ncbi:histidine phosphatase family protein [Mangrovibrevibacter kandeliae]|uniref:histidine phosphatase family protein n=1 Tax=Mangrovibrevibacter kandeliae TaxID=2968473 RepID=UPI002118867D|nr:histidine phosphatase family protein [Aurantimonas sp. CSK15Z-1]MCQ8783445.1 histidine phosphatase family protein [Aurantimonas sp. CSK15Z-1]